MYILSVQTSQITAGCCGVYMSDNSPFLVLEETCDEAIVWFTEQVDHTGMQVVRTFDLQATRQENPDCPCPHHGSDQCDCQMVLLVYHPGHQPISIVAHGFDGQTWFSVVDNPQQRADPHLEATIRHLMALPLPPTINLIHYARSI
jgi:hypothetical protein